MLRKEPSEALAATLFTSEWETPAAVLDGRSSQEGPRGTPAGTEGTAVTASLENLPEEGKALQGRGRSAPGGFSGKNH